VQEIEVDFDNNDWIPIARKTESACMCGTISESESLSARWTAYQQFSSREIKPNHAISTSIRTRSAISHKIEEKETSEKRREERAGPYRLKLRCSQLSTP
jgi:hypothetical protein